MDMLGFIPCGIHNNKRYEFSGNNDYKTPEFSLTGDFEVRFKAYFPKLSNQWIGQLSTGNVSDNRFGINSSGSFVINAGGGISNHGAVPTSAEDKLSTYRIVRSSGKVTVYVNDTELGTSINEGVLSLDTIGSWSKNNKYCTGYLEDLKIWDHEDNSKRIQIWLES